MHPPARATWFLTHRCNLACSYCATILPEQTTPELDEQRTVEISDALCHLEPEVVILTGGEATMHPHAQAVVDNFNLYDQPFVLITNATRPLRLRGVRSISASVDVETPPLRRSQALSDEEFKSSWGFRFLLAAKEQGMDATASVVLHSGNAELVPRLVRSLHEHGIASMLGVVHASLWHPKHQWRIRSTGSTSARLTPDQAAVLAGELCSMYDEGVAILNDRTYLEGIAVHGANLDWHCTEASDLVVDSDGSIMTCSDWWGPTCKRLDVRDALIDRNAWLAAWRMAHDADNRSCPGCFWNCSFQAESPSSSAVPLTPRATRG